MTADHHNQRPPRPVRPFLARLAGLSVLHGLGFSLVFFLTAWLLIPSQSRQALALAYREGLFHLGTPEILLHAGLSACTWALMVILYRLMATRSPGPRLIRARGTVMTETIIVLPIFLIVNMGMIQLALINTAGLLTTLAAFNAGRSIAVWHPEALSSRSNTDLTLVREKAHLAAAASLAPVAPSGFNYNEDDCNISPSARQMITTLARVGHTTDQTSSVRQDGRSDNLSLARAFDVSGFNSRGQRKLTFALCATSVDYQANPADHRVFTVVEYQHQIIVPFISYIFGAEAQNPPGGVNGRFLTITRDNVTSYQLPPSARRP